MTRAASLARLLNASNQLTVADIVPTGNTVLGDAGSDTITFNANTLAIPNNLNIDSGTMFIDASNNNVGIGTTTPSAKIEIAVASGASLSARQFLQVSGSAAAAEYMRITNTGGDGVLGVADSNGAGIVSGGLSYATQLYTVGSTALQFGTNSSIKATIDTSGNFGIGTTLTGSPAKLHVAGSSSTDFKALTLRNADGTTGSASVLGFEVSSGTLGDDAALAAQIKGVRTGSGTTGALAFWTTNAGVPAERVRIDNVGNLLVGTTTAAGKISIGGSGANRISMTASTGTLYVGYDGSNDNLQVASPTDIRFQAGSGYPERMRITSAGNVGIGTSSPAYRLQVVTGAVSGRQTLSNIDRTTGNWVRFTNPEFSAVASMGLLLRVFPDSDARQGAGVLASGGLSNGATDLSLFVSDGTASSTSFAAYSVTGSSTTHTWNKSAGSETMRLDSNGMLGLEITPAQTSGIAIELGGSANNNAINFLNSSNLQGWITSNAYYNGTNWLRKYAGGGTCTAYTANDQGSHVWRYAAASTVGSTISWSEAMRIDSSGKVGINTNAPFETLDVRSTNATFSSGASETNVFITSGYDVNLRYLTRLRTDYFGVFSVATGSGSSLVAPSANSPTERMRIDNSGNLLAYKTMQVTTNPASTFGTATFYTRLTSGTSYTVATGTIQGIDSLATATLEYANLYDYGTATNWAYGLRQAFIRSSIGGTTSQGNNSINAQTSGGSATAPTFAWSGTSPVTLVVTNGGSVEGWARVTVTWRNIAMTFNPVS